MRLVAVYNAWNDVELLYLSVSNILKCVDGVIIVYSYQSNFGTTSNGFDYIQFADGFESNVFAFQCEPEPKEPPHYNETKKRNFGLEKAKQLGYTHFLMMDCDEFYFPDEVEREKVRFKNGLNGLVCRLKVLFSKPTLWCHDHTLVPFIQRLTPDLTMGNYKYYPFAYDHDGSAHIDPTRRPSHRSGVEMSNIFMWHASWVRPDFNVKIFNSSARNNLMKSSIYKDLTEAKEGYYCEFYRDKLQSCPNHFNLPIW